MSAQQVRGPVEGPLSIVRLSQLLLVILSTISLVAVSSNGAPFHRRVRRFISSDVGALVSFTTAVS